MKNAFVRGAGLLFPLLSRYSFLFWLPQYFLILFKKNVRFFVLVGLITTSLVLLFFVLPFVLPHPQMLKTFNEVYIEGAMQEWDGQEWQQAGDRPFQLFQGVGFASWFYVFFEGSLLEKILALKNTLMYTSVLAALLAIVFYFRSRKVMAPDLIALLGLKFCLTIFYAFILVPYLYLFWVPTIISVLILSRVKEDAPQGDGNREGVTGIR